MHLGVGAPVVGVPLYRYRKLSVIAAAFCEGHRTEIIVGQSDGLNRRHYAGEAAREVGPGANGSS